MLSFTSDPIYRRLIDDPTEKRTWCSITYQNHPWLKYYTSAVSIFHFLAPFIINFISAIIIVIKLTRTKSNVQPNNLQMFYGQLLKAQLLIHKHLIISPCVLVSLTLPRLIISFVYVCMKSPRQPYLFLFGYFISYLPSLATFFIFVLPSTTYRKELLKRFKKA
ncbi:unnamed protein product [Didymodactylos carnosus]|uniref:Uncharacterized protein n=1 Tax=Didymodactylos carnosus TaxID=1234261 RepID=A0A815AUE9_9BILA|nr:unnamed protein product [Didymodactylos carnosus]CAF4038438.1 unnamed protein product [Didymodactylos carnosus]